MTNPFPAYADLELHNVAELDHESGYRAHLPVTLHHPPLKTMQANIIFLFLFITTTFLHAGAPTSLLSSKDLSALNLNSPPDKAERESATAEHPVYRNIDRVTVLEAPEHVHQVQLNQRNAQPVAEGETVRIRGAMRSAISGGAPVRVSLFVQDTAHGFKTVSDLNLVIGPQWEPFEQTFIVSEDYAAGRLQFSLFLGAQEQVVELGQFVVEKFASEGAETVVPDAIREVSVQGDYEEVPTTKPDTITGSLPAGWEEDSVWADVAVNYRPQSNNPHSGDRSLRAEVRNVQSGRVQFRVPHVPVDPSHMMRIRLPLRSENSSSFTLTLQQRDAPYTGYWSTSMGAAPEWGEREVIAAVSGSDPDASLIFSMEGPGSLEVGDFTIEYVTAGQLLAARDFTGNLLTTSSFPLGITAPWAVGANGSRPEHASADPENPGPSGVPALRLIPHRYEGRPTMQVTSPFIGRPNHAHTLSFWAKADRPGMHVSLRMGPPNVQIYTEPWSKTVPLTTEWKRYEHTVMLPPAADMTYLARVNSHVEGTFWVDQFMVEVADEVTPFEPTGPVEISAVAERDFGLSFEDEPLGYRVAVTGDLTQAARIEGTVLDLYGNETSLSPLEIDATSGNPVILKTALPPQEELGSFLVTHQVVDAGGQPLGKPSELLLHRVRKPHFWGQTAFDSPFGTHVASTPEQVRMAKALGFNWNRLHYKFGWTGLQKEDGSWNFDGAERMTGAHQEYDVLILTHFSNVPLRYNAQTDSWREGYFWNKMNAAPRNEEEAMAAFQEYCEQLLRNSGESLQAVEVWNEPFLPGFFVGDIVDGRPRRAKPEVYFEMIRRARAAVEATDYKGILLWNAGPHYGESELAFDKAVRDLGGADLLDGLSFHRYTNATLGFPGDRFADDLQVIRETFAESKALEYVWNSEGGHGLSEIFNLYRQVPPGMRSRADYQAAQYVRYYLSNFAAGVEKVFIYTWYPQDGWISNYGYMNVDGQLSQLAPVTSNMAWQLEGKTFTEMRELTPAVIGQHYGGEGENTVVLLPNGRGAAELPLLPAGVQLTDLYGNTPALPTNFTTGLLYVSAPGLTLDHVGQMLMGEEPEGLVVATEPTVPSIERTADSSEENNHLVLWAIIGGAVVLFVILRVALRRR